MSILYILIYCNKGHIYSLNQTENQSKKRSQNKKKDENSSFTKLIFQFEDFSKNSNLSEDEKKNKFLEQNINLKIKIENFKHLIKNNNLNFQEKKNEKSNNISLEIQKPNNLSNKKKVMNIIIKKVCNENLLASFPGISV